MHYGSKGMISLQWLSGNSIYYSTTSNYQIQVQTLSKCLLTDFYWQKC